MKIELTLPDTLQAFVDEQAAGERNASEYILDLIQREKDRHSTRGAVDNLLIEGIESGEIEPFDEDWKEQVMAEVDKRLATQ